MPHPDEVGGCSSVLGCPRCNISANSRFVQHSAANFRERHFLTLQSQVVVHRDGDLLLGAEIALGGLDRGMSEQELDLFEVASGLAAELGAGAAQVMRPKALDADLFG